MTARLDSSSSGMGQPPYQFDPAAIVGAGRSPQPQELRRTRLQVRERRTPETARRKRRPAPRRRRGRPPEPRRGWRVRDRRKPADWAPRTRTGSWPRGPEPSRIVPRTAQGRRYRKVPPPPALPRTPKSSRNRRTKPGQGPPPRRRDHRLRRERWRRTPPSQRAGGRRIPRTPTARVPAVRTRQSALPVERRIAKSEQGQPSVRMRRSIRRTRSRAPPRILPRTVPAPAVRNPRRGRGRGHQTERGRALRRGRSMAPARTCLSSIIVSASIRLSFVSAMSAAIFLSRNTWLGSQAMANIRANCEGKRTWS